MVRQHILLVGPAGCGKSWIAEHMAEVMGLRYGSVNCSAGMGEHHLTGRSIPNLTKGTTTFQGTDFLTCFESGGVFLLDEIDAADPNVLMILNTALANRYCNVPNRPGKTRAQQHDDFILIAAANTFGRGANRMYSGRSQLDEATLDRFRIGTLECDYDTNIEIQLCPDAELRSTLQMVRERIVSSGLRRFMSTRFMLAAYKMKSIAGWTDVKILQKFFSGWTSDEINKAKPEHINLSA